METAILEKITALRHELHAHPELSMHEEGTKRRLIDFLRANTSLEIRDMGRWFYAVYRCGRAGAKKLAVRADFDAVAVAESCELPYRSQNPGVAHKCGHDGHSASLCGLALALENRGADKDVFLLFQHAEETGQGAAECERLIDDEGIDSIFAFHNWEGHPLGSVVVSSGVVQCASKGLTLRFTGKAAHASQPESGRNPAFAIAELTLYVREALSSGDFRGMVLGTVIHTELGSRNFGVAAGAGELSLTLRAHYEDDMLKFEHMLTDKAAALAARDGLELALESSDEFSDTVNDPESAELVRRAAKALGYQLIELREPFRASEDFGRYLKKCPGAMFYLGTGADHAALHTPEYDFPDALLETAVEMEYRIICEY